MKGAIKGHRERIVILAHQTEKMAREKKLKSVDHYLKPKAARSGSSAAVVDMFEALAAEGKRVTIRRVELTPKQKGA